MSKKSKLPNLSNVTPPEVQAILNMFKLYDYECTGKITNYLAKKLVGSLGFETHNIEFSQEVSLNEILLFVDKLSPDAEELPIVKALSTFAGLVPRKYDEYGVGKYMISPEDISDFMESLGRPPASIGEVTLLLNSMQDYDNCEEVPMVDGKVFAREVLNFTKKTNALKDFKLN